MQVAWNTYGENAFTHEIVEPVEDVSQLHIIEQRWIERLRPALNARYNHGNNPNRFRRTARKVQMIDVPLPPPPPPAPPLPLMFLTPEQVAENCEVTLDTVRRWLRVGMLEGEKAGRQWRISEEAVQTFLKRSKEEK